MRLNARDSSHALHPRSPPSRRSAPRPLSSEPQRPPSSGRGIHHTVGSGQLRSWPRSQEECTLHAGSDLEEAFGANAPGPRQKKGPHTKLRKNFQLPTSKQPFPLKFFFAALCPPISTLYEHDYIVLKYKKETYVNKETRVKKIVHFIWKII